MKNYLLALSVLVMGSGVVSVQAQPVVPHNEQLQLEMRQMGTDYQTLGRQLGDAAQNTSSQQLLTNLTASATRSQQLVPHRASTIPEGAERDAYIQDYRNDMQALINGFTAIQTALTANDNAEAVRLNTALGPVIGAAHQKYRYPRPR